jgi:hypothetical protein
METEKTEQEKLQAELIHSHENLLWVLQEAVLQLVEQTVASNPSSASTFEAAMRQRMNALLEGEDHGDQQAEVTSLYNALLTAAGRPPQRG